MITENTKLQEARHPLSNLLRVHPSTLAMTIVIATSTVIPAYATIDNTATTSGTYNSNPVPATSNTVLVPVASTVPGLLIVKSAGTPDLSNGVSGQADVGDTITYTYTVTNDGNVTLTNVVPVDSGPTFNGEAGTGSLAAFVPTSATLPVTLAPGASQEFTAIYTMTDIDAYNAAGVTDGVSNTATSFGNEPNGDDFSDPTISTATTTLPVTANLGIVKSFVLGDQGGGADTVADVGDIIVYTYTVTNTGNVAITDVTIADVHEGGALNLTSGANMQNESLNSDVVRLVSGSPVVSTDATADDGTWSLLQPGGIITFTYTHTVTQTEVDGG